MNSAIENFNKYRQKIDIWVIVLVLSLSLFGLIMIGSASAIIANRQFDGAKDYFFVGKQAITLAIGLLFTFIISRIDYRKYRKYSIVFLIATVVLLVIIFIPGLAREINGARRWIHIGSFFTFQTSELAKITLILYLSSWLENRSGKIPILPFAGIMIVIGLFIINQPDMGTLSVFFGIAAALFICAGASMLQIFGSLGALLAAFWMLIKAAPYRMDRFTTFLNPQAEKLDAGYHINQALYAVGSGGLLGLGFGQSIQKYLYLPEPHTDSIFAIIAEELGFLRSSIIIIVFALLVWRGFRIAKYAPDNFGRYVAVGITSWIAIQTFINIGALTGLIPLTGVPLPFISYGNSSLFALLIAIGILLNISKHSNHERPA